MRTVAELHSAASSLAGYLFQLDLALLWLAQSPIGSVVGIETLDDVVRKDGEGNIRVGQSKLSYAQNLFADRNPNLWKTLGIWVGLIEEDSLDLAKAELHLISNFNAKTGLVAGLKSAKSVADFRALEKKLKAVARELEAKGDEHAMIVGNCDSKIVTELLQRIRVSDGIPSHPRSQLPLFSGAMNLPAELATDVIRGMRGWVLEHAEISFAERKPAWLEKEQFSGELARLVSLHYDNRLVLRAAKEIEVKPEDQAAAKNALFVEQMRWVDAQSDEILDAIGDYFRSIDERTRLAVDNDVSRREFDGFENRLVDRWKGIHRACGDTFDEPKKAGRLALRKTLDHREPLAGQPTSEFYLTRGVYHQLANRAEAELGWHPDFKKLLTES